MFLCSKKNDKNVGELQLKYLLYRLDALQLKLIKTSKLCGVSVSIIKTNNLNELNKLQYNISENGSKYFYIRIFTKSK